MAKRFTEEEKGTVLLAIKNGTSVVDASEQFHVSTHTIYAWLKKQTDNTGTSSLAIARLKRENEELKMLIGELTLDNTRSKKKNTSWS